MDNIGGMLLMGGIGLVVGLLLGWLFNRDRGLYKTLLDKCEKALGEEREKSYRLGSEVSGLQVTLTGLQEKSREQERFFQEALGEMEGRFKALSHDALQENNRSFLQFARQTLEQQKESSLHLMEEKEKNIGSLLDPVREQLGLVARKMQEIEKEHMDAYGAVTARITDMISAQGELRRETGNLVKALRAPQTRGRWGEIQLRRVVELAGMLEHCDFTQQTSVTTGEGDRLRPDMLIHLPGDKSIVVDAKTPLYAYLDALEADDEPSKAGKMKEHARQVKNHISQLGAKSYWAQFEQAPDFVVMFLPGDPFYSAAMEQEPDLIEYGVARDVILATPTTLIALLKSVSYGWQQASLARDAREISRLGRLLYGRLGVLVGHFGDLKKGLDRSVDAYNKAVRSFESRVLVTARKFETMGLGSAESLEPLEPVEEVPRNAQEWDEDLTDSLVQKNHSNGGQENFE